MRDIEPSGDMGSSDHSQQLVEVQLKNIKTNTRNKLSQKNCLIQVLLSERTI